MPSRPINQGRSRNNKRNPTGNINVVVRKGNISGGYVAMAILFIFMLATFAVYLIFGKN